MDGITDFVIICNIVVLDKGLCLSPRRGLIYLLEYRESGKCPARGISEGFRENPGSDDYVIIRESPVRMFTLI